LKISSIGNCEICYFGTYFLFHIAYGIQFNGTDPSFLTNLTFFQIDQQIHLVNTSQTIFYSLSLESGKFSLLELYYFHHNYENGTNVRIEAVRYQIFENSFDSKDK